MRYVGQAAEPCCAACAGTPVGSPPLSTMTRAVLLGDAHARKVAGMQHGSQTMGDLLPTFVFPSDVAAYKRKVDPAAKATNADAVACKTLPAKQAKAWADWFAEWRAFVDGGTRLLGSWEAQLEQAKAYERELADWQSLISDTCTLSTPQLDPPGKPFPTGAVLVLGGAAVVVAALGYSFYKTGQQAGRRANAGKKYLEGEVDRRLSGGGETRSTSKKALARR